jgi:hypothetical protein
MLGIEGLEVLRPLNFCWVVVLKLIQIIYVITGLLLFSPFQSGVSAQEQGKLVVPETSHNFGVVKQGDVISYTFVIRNTDVVPLNVERFELSQLGMTARATPMIAAGAEGKITLKWDTRHVTGKLSGKGILYFDDPVQKPIVLVLSGVVKPPIEFVPARVVYLSTFKGESAAQTVTIINHDESRPLEITRIERRGEHFVAELHTPRSGNVYNVVLTIPSDTPPGRYLEALEVHTDDPTRSPLMIGVNILVKGNLYTFPQILEFNTIHGSQVAGQVTQSLLVKKREGQFEIKRVTSTIPFLAIEREPDGKSATFRIDVSIDSTQLKPGTTSGVLRIETDDSEFPEVVVPVRVELR